MKKIILIKFFICFLCIFLFRISVFSQYKFEQNIAEKSLNTYEIIPFTPMMKTYLGQILILSQSSKTQYTLESIDIVTNQKKKLIAFSFKENRIVDFSYNKSGLWLLAGNNVYKVVGTQCIVKAKPDTRWDFEKLLYLDEQSFLIYNLYPYHPFDGSDSLQMYLFNTKSNTIIKQRKVPFEGKSLGNIIHDWVTIIDDKKIAVCYPLTGKILIFDLNFNTVDSFVLNIDDVNKKAMPTLYILWMHKSNLQMQNCSNMLPNIQEKSLL